MIFSELVGDKPTFEDCTIQNSEIIFDSSNSKWIPDKFAKIDIERKLYHLVGPYVNLSSSERIDCGFYGRNTIDEINESWEFEIDNSRLVYKKDINHINSKDYFQTWENNKYYENGKEKFKEVNKIIPIENIKLKYAYFDSVFRLVYQPPIMHKTHPLNLNQGPNKKSLKEIKIYGKYYRYFYKKSNYSLNPDDKYLQQKIELDFTDTDEKEPVSLECANLEDTVIWEGNITSINDNNKT